jgi:hypothetical protein
MDNPSVTVLLGCRTASRNEHRAHVGIVRMKEFICKPVLLSRPDAGVATETVVCDLCGRSVTLNVLSERATWWRQCGGFLVFPGFGLAAFFASLLVPPASTVTRGEQALMGVVVFLISIFVGGCFYAAKRYGQAWELASVRMKGKGKKHHLFALK